LGKLLGDTAAVIPCILHHADMLKCRPRRYGTNVHMDLSAEDATG